MAKRIRYLITWVLSLGTCVAGTLSVGPAGPLRFTVWAFSPPSLALAVDMGEGGRLPLQFHPTMRSPVYEYAGASRLRFMDAETGEAVAEADIPTEWQRVLLIFAPTPGSVARWRYQILVVDDSAEGLPKGTIRVLNRSGWTLRGAVNGQAREFPPGLSPALASSGAVDLQLRAVLRGRWWQSHASQFELGAEQRALLVVLPPYYPGSPEVQVRRLVDSPP